MTCGTTMGASRSSPRIRDSNRGPCSYARHASECSSHRPLSSAIAEQTRRPSAFKVSRSTFKVVLALNLCFRRETQDPSEPGRHVCTSRLPRASGDPRGGTLFRREARRSEEERGLRVHVVGQVGGVSATDPSDSHARTDESTSGTR